LKLNITFIAPTWHFNITSKAQWVEAALNLMQDRSIDYLIEPIFLRQEVFNPNLTTLSTGLFRLDQISVITQKSKISKIGYEELNSFDKEIWISLLMAFIAHVLLLPLLSKSSSINSFFSLFSMILSQSVHKIDQLSRHITIYTFLLACVILCFSYKADLLDKIMREPKEWCETLQCFADTNKTFIIPTDNLAFTALKSDHLEFYERIKDRSKILELFGYELKDLLDVIKGNVIVILDSSTSEKFLAAKRYYEGIDEYLVTARNDSVMHVGMIRKGHPKSELMRRKMNECLEFGIIDKWSEQTIHMLSLIIHVLIKYGEKMDEGFETYAISLVNLKDSIYLEDCQATFKCLMFGLIISLIAFMIEIF
jgi:hypothetical protein